MGIKLGTIFSLESEDKKRLHTEALEWFNARRAEIQREVPLEELSDGDLNTFLSDDEKREYQNCMTRIGQRLFACINTGEASPDPLADITTRLNLVRLEVESLSSTYRIRLLLKKTYDRKMAKATEDQRKREEEERQQAAKLEEEQRQREEAAEAKQREKEEKERWRAALKTVNPPLEDAQRYLYDQEYYKFKEAAVEAIEVYLEKREDYLHDMRTFDYRWLLDKINSKKAEQSRKATAYIAAREFNNCLNEQIAESRSRLVSKPTDLRAYFTTAIKDERYSDGYHFSFVLSKAESKDLDRTLVIIANERLEQCIPESLRQFVDIPSQYHRIYFPLPSISYSMAGVPCLNISFDIFAAAYTGVRLKPIQKRFGDYLYKLPWIEEQDPVELKEPAFLGYYYLILTPEDLDGHFFWKTIPLVLLKGLLNGGVQTVGAIVTVADENSTTYRIPGFNEDIHISNAFTDYLESICSISEMINKWRIAEKVGSIIKNSLDEFKVEQETSPSKDRIERRDSKKAKAFRLFDEGRIPSDREVKALMIKPETSYNYYQQWKKVTRY